MDKSSYKNGEPLDRLFCKMTDCKIMFSWYHASSTIYSIGEQNLPLLYTCLKTCNFNTFDTQ